MAMTHHGIRGMWLVTFTCIDHAVRQRWSGSERQIFEAGKKVLHHIFVIHCPLFWNVNHIFMITMSTYQK